jgi:FkbM family methyltransferase
MTPMNEILPSAAAQPAGTRAVTITLTQFDRRHYVELIRARGEAIRQIVRKLKPALGWTTAVDAGCGVGFFTHILQECGLSAGGFDARVENVAEARKRFPQIAFEQGDLQDPRITQLGKFDLTLCFGLLYHLENPMLAIRHLRGLTGKGLLLESMCLPGDGSGMVLREEPSQEDQSLREIALYPSEGCLVKMLYRAGFAAVYRAAELPNHDDFRETAEHVRRRTVLFATTAPVKVAGFESIAEPRENGDPWAKSAASSRVASPGMAYRLRRFASRPRRAQYISVAQRARRVLPEMPIPLRLGFGAWWLAQSSALDGELMHGNFETAEIGFVQKLLRPGMTVLDVGAHHGLYTLLMSKKVGELGRVVAFEPSPRELRRLRRHVQLNRCRNVMIEPFALADVDSEADFFVVDGVQDWCNSLRPPAVDESTSTVRVEVRRLDDVLEKPGIVDVDFIKLDVEGAELSFLRGAERVLSRGKRPVILAEVQDIRTRPWGYAAREIIEFLVRADYCWFALGADSRLQRVSTKLSTYDANLVAVAEERLHEFRPMLA